jgi:AcrR family transcriptional regulator
VPQHPQKTRTLPRKSPDRGAGREIVGAIVESAMRILSAEGYERLTTNRIAKAAGVSIGSLYQYFPSKQAVLAAIAKVLEGRALEIMMHVFNESVERDVRDLTRSLVRELAGERLGHMNMRREILDHVPRIWVNDASRAVDDQVGAFLARYIAEHPALPKPNPALSAFLVMHAVEATLEAAVARRPELLTSEEFFDELSELVSAYLTAPAREASPPDVRTLD